MIECFLPCVPPSASHHAKKIITIKTRDGRQFHKLGDKPELQAARQMIDGLLTPHRPRVALSGPLTLTLEFTWPWLASHPLKVRALGRIPKTTRPDGTNLAKTTEDRLVALLFLTDDALVTELVVRKFHGDHPGIGIRLEPCLDPVQTVVPPMACREPREGGLLV